MDNKSILKAPKGDRGSAQGTEKKNVKDRKNEGQNRSP